MTDPIAAFKKKNKPIHCRKNNAVIYGDCSKVSGTSRKGMQFHHWVSSEHPCKGCEKAVEAIRKMKFAEMTPQEKAAKIRHNMETWR